MPMKNFKESEFKCGCGKCFLGFAHINQVSFGKLQDARERANVPFIITSSIRCKSHNQRTGGTMTSAHLTGQAFDILANNVHTRFRILKALLDAGFTRIGIAKDYIHADDDNSKTPKVTWLY